MSEISSTGPALSVAGLSKRFGGRVAFENVSFEVSRGEVFGFLGPNGAGKTTTVRTLATLLAPTAGTATVAGLALRPENGVQIRRRIAVMPEAPGLYLRLSVVENLQCFAELYGVTSPAQQIARVLRAVGWHPDGVRGYLLSVSDPTAAAPGVARALVAAGADILSISPSQHSLEDVYLKLLDEEKDKNEDEDEDEDEDDQR